MPRPIITFTLQSARKSASLMRPSRAEPQTLPHSTCPYAFEDTPRYCTLGPLHITLPSKPFVSRRIQSTLVTSVLGSAWSLSRPRTNLVLIRDTSISAIEPGPFPKPRFLSIYHPSLLLCLVFPSAELDTIGLEPGCEIHSPSKN